MGNTGHSESCENSEKQFYNCANTSGMSMIIIFFTLTFPKHVIKIC